MSGMARRMGTFNESTRNLTQLHDFTTGGLANVRLKPLTVLHNFFIPKGQASVKDEPKLLISRLRQLSHTIVSTIVYTIV